MLRFATAIARVLQNRLVWWVAGVADAAIIYALIKHVRWV